ncbi:Bifunctional purine biosynthesis protein PurH OS=Streptomyces microflavus OX=1919 GN=purH PE=4 SV=1 [Streptomyces microflavus]
MVVNLYPFKETVASGASDDECVEQIDIGGPSMVRAAAKNHPSVAVVTAKQYGDVLAAVKAGGFDLTARKRLAAEAFQHTAAYDVAVASWFVDGYAPADDWASRSSWATPSPVRTSCATARTRTSPPPSTPRAPAVWPRRSSCTARRCRTTTTDTDAARRAAYDHAEPCVAIIKHANPCGIAIADDVAEAHRKAHACDPLSAFGGVIAVNRPVTVKLAEQEIFTDQQEKADQDDEATRGVPHGAADTGEEEVRGTDDQAVDDQPAARRPQCASSGIPPP